MVIKEDKKNNPISLQSPLLELKKLNDMKMGLNDKIYYYERTVKIREVLGMTVFWGWGEGVVVMVCFTIDVWRRWSLEISNEKKKINTRTYESIDSLFTNQSNKTSKLLYTRTKNDLLKPYSYFKLAQCNTRFNSIRECNTLVFEIFNLAGFFPCIGERTSGVSEF